MFHRQQDTVTTEENENQAVEAKKEEKSMMPKNNDKSQGAEEKAGVSDKESSEERGINIPGQSTTPYGTGSQFQSGRVPGAFANKYSNSSSHVSTSNGRRLLIGEGITLSGEIEACDILVVEGTVEAALRGANMLEISETGMFYGTVDIDEAIIAGRFEGDLTVNGRLTIAATGSITGSISYKELAVEAGATLDGTISPLDGVKKQKPEPSKKKGKAIKSAPPKNDNSGNDELPFDEQKKSNAS